MGLNLYLLNLRDYREGDEGDSWYRHQDDRFDWLRHIEDRDFVAWLNARNAVFKVIGTPEQLDEARRWTGITGSLEQLLEEQGGIPWRYGFPLTVSILERPKDFVAARAWVRDYVHPFPGIWDQQRYWHLLDLLESDEKLWLFESE